MRDLKDQRFGKLLAIHPDGKDRHGNIFWSCLCDCGQMKTISGASLRRGLTRSCGCFVGENHRARHARAYEGSGGRTGGFRLLMNGYKVDARRRSKTWNLSDDEFEALTRGLCTYCGAPPAQVCRPKGKSYVHNGIDRIDSALGYEPGNVVSCCRTCNMMKNDRTVEEFKRAVAAIYGHFVASPAAILGSR